MVRRPKFRSYTPQDDNLLVERAETGKTVNGGHSLLVLFDPN